MNKTIKDALVLTIITIVAGALLGFTFIITKGFIEKAAAKKQNEAYKSVVSDGKSFNELSSFNIDNAKKVLESNDITGVEVLSVYEGKDGDNNIVGYAINTVSHEGFGGDISLTVGISSTGETLGVSILSISETAGLGMRATEKEFISQYAGKTVEKFIFTKTGKVEDNEIDSISGATITTNAVTNGVNAAVVYFNSELKEGK